MFWKAIVKLEFRLKNMYEYIKRKKISVHWKSAIWFPSCIPKHSFMTWMIIVARLKTLERMYQ